MKKCVIILFLFISNCFSSDDPIFLNALKLESSNNILNGSDVGMGSYIGRRFPIIFSKKLDLQPGIDLQHIANYRAKSKGLFKLGNDGKHGEYIVFENLDYKQKFVSVLYLESHELINVSSRSITSLDVSPDGRYIVFFDGSVGVIDLHERTIRRTLPNSVVHHNVVITSDSKHVVVSIGLRRDEPEVEGLCIINLYDFTYRFVPSDDKSKYGFSNSTILSIPNNKIISYTRSISFYYTSPPNVNDFDKIFFIDLENDTYSVYTVPCVSRLEIGTQALAVTRNQRFFATVNDDSQYKKLLLLNGMDKSCESVNGDFTRAYYQNKNLAFTYDNRLVVFSRFGSKIFLNIINLEKKQVEKSFQGDFLYQNLVISPDGKYLITTEQNKKGLIVFDLDAYTKIYKQIDRDFISQHFAISSDSKYLFTIDGSLKENNIVRFNLSDVLGLNSVVEEVSITTPSKIFTEKENSFVDYPAADTSQVLKEETDMEPGVLSGDDLSLSDSDDEEASELNQEALEEIAIQDVTDVDWGDL